ncbi:ABC-ATPase domain-containing protein [Spirulina major]|uniref:ABC-ATPase domain-containing protein n=1 Tax=Spirulina major TaxID=270636 RepID=UPI000933FFEA|nr:ABC-ATPase domain-containing protein [Spirulina major]
MSVTSLRNTLYNLDGASYGAYKSLKGRYELDDFTLSIDHVQGDPFAAPSRVHVEVPQAIAQFPPHLFNHPSREIALRDYLLRRFARVAADLSGRRGSGKSGAIEILSVGQEVLEQTAVWVDAQRVEARFTVGLPAQGRRILGRQAAALLCEDVPELVARSLLAPSLDLTAVQRHVETVEDADALRGQLAARGLIAFVANGSILPRRSGVDARPLGQEAIAFQSPSELEYELITPNRGPIRGMGIPQGITVIVGGGYHGKSTLLKAVELGVYNHIPGDGRDYVVSDPAAVKIRAEDGRSIVGVNISPFINHLPQGRSTRHFSTPNASGSTSQAANIIEALEAGAQVLLIDEDTAATNFMIRDRRMQQLIAKANEPITPLIDKIRQLWTEQGVSSLLVMGGSGDYFDVADRVIALDNFVPQDVTAQAHAIAQAHPTDRQPEGGANFGELTPRIPIPSSLDPSRGKHDVKVRVRDLDAIAFGSDDIDLSAVEQLVNPGQLRAIAAALVEAKSSALNGHTPIPTILDTIMTQIHATSLDSLTPKPLGDSVAFRRFELAAALNRLRSLRVQP